MCGVNVGDLLCGTSIASIESIKSIECIESVESSDSIESLASIQSIEPIESIVLVRADFKKMRFSIFGSVILMHVLCLGAIFRFRDPSKNLRHVVRINFVQFSAPELQQ